MARNDYRKRKPKLKQYPDLVTHLGQSQHKIWSDWMSYFFSQCDKQERPILDFKKDPADQKNKNHLDDMPTMRGKEVTLIIPADLVEDTRKLMNTPWEDLPLASQEAFQDEVATILKSLQAYGDKMIASMKEGDEER